MLQAQTFKTLHIMGSNSTRHGNLDTKAGVKIFIENIIEKTGHLQQISGMQWYLHELTGDEINIKNDLC